MPIEVGHHREVSMLRNRPQQRGDDGLQISRATEQDRVVGVHRNRAFGEDRDTLGEWAIASFVKDLAGVVLRFLNVRLIERIDAKHAPSNHGRVLPRHELRAERSRYGGTRDMQVLAEGDEMPIGRIGKPWSIYRLDDDRQQASAVLSGRFGDQLLGPIAEPRVPRAEVSKHDFVAASEPGLAKYRAQRQAGIVVVAVESR